MELRKNTYLALDLVVLNKPVNLGSRQQAGFSYTQQNCRSSNRQQAGSSNRQQTSESSNRQEAGFSNTQQTCESR